MSRIMFSRRQLKRNRNAYHHMLVCLRLDRKVVQTPFNSDVIEKTAAILRANIMSVMPARRDYKEWVHKRKIAGEE